jgi:hypothetical protein
LPHGFQGFLVGDLLKPLDILELNVTVFTADEAIVLKPGKYAANRLFRNTEIITDIAAGHAQGEFGGRTMPLFKLPGQVEQENGNPLLGIVFTEQEQQFLTVMDFSTHDF